MKNIKTIHIETPVRNLDEVSKYLPGNYMVTGFQYDATRQANMIVVTGEDVAGWTAESYVIPRLASGMYSAKLIEGK